MVSMFCVSQLSYHCHEICNTHSLKEGRFNFDHCFRRFRTWLSGSKAETSWQRGIEEQSCLVHCGLEAEQGNGAGEELYILVPKAVLPPHTPDGALLTCCAFLIPVKLTYSANGYISPSINAEI